MTTGTTGPDLVATTITELAARLPVRMSRGRDGLLREAHDGLLDAAEAYEQQGYPPAEAARRAVADFGELDQLVEEYGDHAVRDQARWTSTVLTTGYLLMLSAWWVLHLLAPERPDTGVREWAASSFGGIGAFVAAVTAVVLLAARRTARRGRQGTLLAWVAGASGVACAVATLTASYLVQPWGDRPAHALPLSQWTGPVEVLSAVVTFGILALSLRCLRSAWRVRHHRREGRTGAAAA